jgi:butyryl-CoA dehydrogenase
MDFNLSEEQQSLKNMAAKFAADRLFPNAQAWDAACYFPVEVLKEAAALGMGAMNVRADVGGSALSRMDSAIIFEQLAAGCIATAAYLSIHNMVLSLLDKYASDEIRQHYGPRLARMELFASYCLTEPEAGSDAASLKTRAEKKQDHYLVNGTKAFISGGGASDVYLCMVRTSDHPHHGVTCLLIEKNTPGLSFGVHEKKMGWRAQPTTMVYFENCKIPLNQRVGDEGMGFVMALNALNGGRINIAACSLGGALASLKLTQKYMGERKQFGKALQEMQALRFYYAEMLTAYETARLMVYRAAQALDNGQPDAPYWCAMAKQYTTDCAFSISDRAMQLHGGYGYLQDYHIERIFRDLRVHQILEGTNEIMKEIIAKAALDKQEVLCLMD